MIVKSLLSMATNYLINIKLEIRLFLVVIWNNLGNTDNYMSKLVVQTERY